MRRYQKIVRALFAVVFIAGGIAHLVLGRLQPEGYAVFADTALFPWLSSLWMSFAMSHIGWLTLALGAYEIACGIGMISQRSVTIAAWGMLAFLVFITIVGYGFPVASRRRLVEEPADHHRDGGDADTAAAHSRRRHSGEPPSRLT